MTKRKIFYKIIAIRPQKRRGLLTKINKHYLFWLNLKKKNQCKTKKLLKNVRC